MPNLKFYDVKAKKSFTTDKFTITTVRTGKRVTRIAKTKSPLTGITSTRIVSKDFKA